MCGIEDAGEWCGQEGPDGKDERSESHVCAPAAWKTKSKARNARTTPATNQTISNPGDLPDHTRVVLRRMLAPVTGSADVWVVLVTPLWFCPSLATDWSRVCIPVISDKGDVSAAPSHNAGLDDPARSTRCPYGGLENVDHPYHGHPERRDGLGPHERSLQGRQCGPRG